MYENNLFFTFAGVFAGMICSALLVASVNAEYLGARKTKRSVIVWLVVLVAIGSIIFVASELGFSVGLIAGIIASLVCGWCIFIIYHEQYRIENERKLFTGVFVSALLFIAIMFCQFYTIHRKNNGIYGFVFDDPPKVIKSENERLIETISNLADKIEQSNQLEEIRLKKEGIGKSSQRQNVYDSDDSDWD